MRGLRGGGVTEEGGGEGGGRGVGGQKGLVRSSRARHTYKWQGGERVEGSRGL